jgi:hypothetical protein
VASGFCDRPAAQTLGMGRILTLAPSGLPAPAQALNRVITCRKGLSSLKWTVATVTVLPKFSVLKSQSRITAVGMVGSPCVRVLPREAITKIN